MAVISVQDDECCVVRSRVPNPASSGGTLTPVKRPGSPAPHRHHPDHRASADGRLCPKTPSKRPATPSAAPVRGRDSAQLARDQRGLPHASFGARPIAAAGRHAHSAPHRRHRRRQAPRDQTPHAPDAGRAHRDLLPRPHPQRQLTAERSRRVITSPSDHSVVDDLHSGFLPPARRHDDSPTPDANRPPPGFHRGRPQ